MSRRGDRKYREEDEPMHILPRVSVDENLFDTDNKRFAGLREGLREDIRILEADKESSTLPTPLLSLAYSITPGTLQKAKKYLENNTVKVKNLKELLVSQTLLSQDQSKKLLITNTFKGNSLYDYDLSKYVHTDDDENKAINNIVYTLKYINNIYLIVLNNEPDKEAFKLSYQNKKYKLNQANLVENGSPEAPAPAPAKPNAVAEKQAVPDIVSDSKLQKYNSVKNKLQEFILIYNSLVSNIKYQLKEQTGEKIEQLQYKKNLTTFTPAFDKDRRWWDNWDKETVKGDIISNMHNILVEINENIISLQLTNLETSINDAISAIKKEEYDKEKETIINVIKREYLKAKSNIQSLISMYNRSITKKGLLKTEDDKEDINILTYTPEPAPQEINNLNLTITKLKNRYKYILNKKTDIVGFNLALTEFNNAIKKVYNLFKITPLIRVDLSAKGGNPPAKYKSTGITVSILYEKKKYKRTVYTKDNRKTKYCKINNKYMLLSKLNVIE